MAPILSCERAELGARARGKMVTDIEQCEVGMFHQSIMACGDSESIARKVKLAFKKMPGEMALVCFAQAMTANLPHPVKLAV